MRTRHDLFKGAHVKNHMKKLRCVAMAAGFWMSIAAFAQTADPAPLATPGVAVPDHFFGGGEATSSSPVPGDLFIGGGQVEVQGDVGGDLLAAGGQLRLTAPIGASVYAAGGKIHLGSGVRRNARLMGGEVEVASAARVAGNLTVLGGNVRIVGAVDGHVMALGGSVEIDGPVGGDVDIGAGKASLGPHARIAGRLRYQSDEALRVDPAAKVAGGIEHIEVPAARDGRKGAGHEADGWIWSIGLMTLAAVLVYALPGFYLGVGTTARQRIGLCLLLGLAVLACMPVAAVMALVTVIGIPIGVVLLLAYPIALVIGYASAAIVLGDTVLLRWRGSLDGSALRRAGAAALAMFALALLTRVPFLGGPVLLAATLAGLGALALQIRPRRTAA